MPPDPFAPQSYVGHTGPGFGFVGQEVIAEDAGKLDKLRQALPNP
jgi:hypothetical protein